MGFVEEHRNRNPRTGTRQVVVINDPRTRRVTEARPMPGCAEKPWIRHKNMPIVGMMPLWCHRLAGVMCLCYDETSIL